MSLLLKGLFAGLLLVLLLAIGAEVTALHQASSSVVGPPNAGVVRKTKRGATPVKMVRRVLVPVRVQPAPSTTVLLRHKKPSAR